MPAIPDVLIVGGGILGVSCARALATAGAQVSLLQRPPAPGDAWRASAGMLAAQVEAQPDDPIFPLALAGRAFYRRNATLLRETTGIDIGLVECGILQLLWHERERDEASARVAVQRQHGHRADLLSADDVIEGWPWLGPCAAAYWSPEDAAVVPDRVVAALRADAGRLGAHFISDTAIALDRAEHRVQGVIGAERRYAAGAVVIAAGAWSGRIENLPRPLSVEPVRGQMMAFAWPVGIAPAIVYGERCYLLQRGDELLVGATVEHAGFDTSVTASGLAELRRRASAIYPMLTGVEPQRTWAGLRPGTPDGQPIIGAEPRLDGLWYATGHGRNGILLAGITGELVARAIRGEPASHELDAFRPERFWNW